MITSTITTTFIHVSTRAIRVWAWNARRVVCITLYYHEVPRCGSRELPTVVRPWNGSTHKWNGFLVLQWKRMGKRRQRSLWSGILHGIEVRSALSGRSPRSLRAFQTLKYPASDHLIGPESPQKSIGAAVTVGCTELIDGNGDEVADWWEEYIEHLKGFFWGKG